MTDALVKLGAQPVPFVLDHAGMQTWEVLEQDLASESELPDADVAVSPPPVLVLAGGLGTRLRAVIADRPKVLAPVAGGTFLNLLVARLHAGGTRRIVLLVGHLHEQVERHVAERLRPAYPGLEIACSVEPTPLGTAGALRHAAALCGETFLALNGDTFFELDTAALVAAHRPRRQRDRDAGGARRARRRALRRARRVRGRPRPRLLREGPGSRARDDQRRGLRDGADMRAHPARAGPWRRAGARLVEEDDGEAGVEQVEIAAESYAELESYLGNRKGT